MTHPRLNRDIAAEHSKALLWANESWFYGYHFSEEDMKRAKDAIEFFSQDIKVLEEQQEKI